MLDIIITHYNEPWETGEKLFRMIGLQRCVDFNAFSVTVVNDGGNRLPEEKLEQLSYPVRQVDIPHGGVSRARNAGMDNTDQPWIMFCDFDDVFTNVYALKDILSVLPCECDMLWSKLIVEDFLDGHELLYISPDNQKTVFIHGKVYRRAFLKEQGIRFDEGMPFQEDSLFNAMIIARADYRRIGEIKAYTAPYAWTRRQNSVTNSGRDAEAAYWHFRRNLIVTEEHRKNTDRYCGMITRTIYDTFYMINGRKQKPELKIRVLTEFIPWLKAKKDYFGLVSDDYLRGIIDVSRYELLLPGERLKDDTDTVRAWIDKITDGGE